MALIKCPECSKDVSDTTYKCNNCGFILNKPKRGVTGKIFKALFIVFNFLMIISFISLYYGLSQADPQASESGATAVAGVAGTGTLIFIWIALGLPLGIMNYITRPKAYE